MLYILIFLISLNISFAEPKIDNTDVVVVGKNKGIAQIYPEKVNYYDIVDRKYRKIDTVAKTNSDTSATREYDKYVNAGRFRATWFNNKSYNYTFRVGIYHVTYEALFDTSLTDIEIKTDVTNDGIKETVIIKNNKAPKVYSWKVITNANVKLKDNQLIFTDTDDNFLFRVRKPIIKNRSVVVVPIVITYKDGILTYDLVTFSGHTFPIEFDPSTTVDYTEAASGSMTGRETTYAPARTNAYADPDVAYFRIGQLHVDNPREDVYRSFLTFNTSSLDDGIDIDSVKLKMVVLSDLSTTNFNMRLCASTFSGANIDSTWFRKFVGYNAGTTPHTPTYLSDDTHPTNAISNGDTIEWKFNAAGLDSINVIGDTHLTLLSSLDISATVATGSEYVTFKGTVDGYSPYLQIWYTVPPSAYARNYMYLNEPRYIYKDGDNIPLYKKP